MRHVYGLIGKSTQQLGGRHPGKGWVQVDMQRPTLDAVATVDGEWITPDIEDIAAGTIRAERDRRLQSCDWTQLPDAALTDEQIAEWANYRQALRDIPAQEGFPWSGDINAVPWPTAPNK